MAEEEENPQTGPLLLPIVCLRVSGGSFSGCVDLLLWRRQSMDTTSCSRMDNDDDERSRPGTTISSATVELLRIVAHLIHGKGPRVSPI